MPVKLESELIEIVLSYWQRSQKPILLSLLGESLSIEAQQEKAEMGMSLADIIRSQLTGSLRLVQVPRHGNGVVPTEATQSLSDAELSIHIPPPKIRTDEPLRDSSHVVEKDIWVLFRYGLKSGKTAFIEVSDKAPALVHQLDDRSFAMSGWIEVTVDDLPKTNADRFGASPSETGNAIRAWAAKHSVAMDSMQKPRESFTNPSYGSRISGSRHSSLAAFVSGMASLEAGELARIFIPADIVVNLILRSGAKG